MLLDHRASAAALQSANNQEASAAGANNPRPLDGMERHLSRLADQTGSEAAATLLSCLRLLQPPNPPSSVSVEAVSADAVQVTLLTDVAMLAPTAALFRVDWRQPDVGADWSSREVAIRQPSVSCLISGLASGLPVSVRVSAFGLAGWSRFAYADEGDVVPSAWWQADAAEAAASDRPMAPPPLAAVSQLRVSLNSELAAWLKDRGVQDGDEPNGVEHHSSLHHRAGGLRRLFASFAGLGDSKLTRRPKPDRLYLTAAVFLEPRHGFEAAEKVLLTKDEVLPHSAVGCDLASAQGELPWLSRLLTDSPCFGAVLDRLERLVCDDKDADQTALPPQLLARAAILKAGRALQTALSGSRCPGTAQLQLLAFPRPLTATSRHLLLVGWVAADDQEAAAALTATGCRWASVASGGELLTGRLLAEVVAFSARSQAPQEPGLYLSSLRLRGTSERLSLEVDARAPNCLPSVRLRRNAHVTAEEMRLLRGIHDVACPLCPALMKLISQLTEAADTLSDRLKLSASQRAGLRLFTGRVIQPCGSVAHLLLLPARRTRLCSRLQQLSCARKQLLTL
ncbi:hypothetical protein BOX15_Mlig010650g1 [Macrostomum lignano]|uniref:Fibronectin type-III domain-containing protein n=1 Tax=Macrostomum lignano TaxID=282301 RepID=A0A267FEZ6_9PLAT|nr:hypothetical protein BOX15_Mlig010650g1 [Macrostomum lignano]